MKPSAQIIRLTFLGGALGTLIRFALFLTFGDLPSVIFVNLVGAGLIGWLNGNKKFDNDIQNALWKTGFAGGFTTMSGVAIWLVVTDGFTAAGAALVFGQIAIGLDAYWLALRAAKKRGRR